MAKRVVGREWTAQDERALKKHSKDETGALRQKARNLGISIGHRQRPKKRTRRG